MMPPSRLDCPLSLKTPNKENTGLKDSQCQNGQVPLFGRQSEQLTVAKSWEFIKAMQELRDTWR